MRYAISVKDDVGPIFWTTRVDKTDNYSTDAKDATLFPDRSSALALIKTLGLDSEHEVQEVKEA